MMKSLLTIISFLGLGLTIIPSLLVFAGVLQFDLNKTLMTAGTLIWFATAPFWINKEDNKETE